MSFTFPDGYTALTPVTGTEKIMAARLSDGKMFYINLSDITGSFATVAQLSTETAARTAQSSLQWIAQVYPIGSQVTYLGKDYVNATVATLAADVPGTSGKWTNRLSAYDGIRTTKTANLINPFTWSVGFILVNGGMAAAQSAYTTTDFFKVNQGSQYGIYYGPTFIPLTGGHYYWYTIDKVAIGSAFSSTDATTGLTTVPPANAAYMRFSMLTSLMTNNAIAVEGTAVPAAWVKYGYILGNTIDSPVFAAPSLFIDAMSDQTVKDVITSVVATKKAFITPDSTNFLIKTANLINPFTWSVGFILVNGGVPAAQSGYTTTDFFKVNQGSQYGIYYGSTFTPLTSGRYYWYTIDKVAAGTTFSATDATTGLTTVPPVNAAYMRFSIQTSFIMNNAIAVEGTAVPTAWVKYGYVLGNTVDSTVFAAPSLFIDAMSDQTVKDAVTSAVSAKRAFITPDNTNFLNLGVNRLDNNAIDFQSGYAMDRNTGITTVNAAFSTTGFMPVTAGKSYTYSGDGIGMGGLTLSAWFDGNKKWLATATYTNNITVAPAGAVYHRGCIQIASFSKLMFIEETSAGVITMPGRNIVFGYVFDQKKVAVTTSLGNWDGKNWVALGDSITLQGQWFQSFIAATGLKNTYNLGSTGALLGTRADALTADMLTNCDIVTVLGGTNDYGHGGDTLGTITDDKTTNTIAGAVANVVDIILTLKPSQRIVFMTPTNRGYYATEPNYTPPAANRNGLTMEGIAKMIQDKCRYMGIPCWDAFGQSGINSYTFSTMTVDGLHPTGVGATRIGTGFGQFVNRVGP